MAEQVISTIIYEKDSNHWRDLVSGINPQLKSSHSEEATPISDFLANINNQDLTDISDEELAKLRKIIQEIDKKANIDILISQNGFALVTEKGKDGIAKSYRITKDESGNYICSSSPKELKNSTNKAPKPESYTNRILAERKNNVSQNQGAMRG